MRLRDFILLVAVCLTWGFSNVLSKMVVAHWHIPPLFFAAVRFGVVFAVTFPGSSRCRGRHGASCSSAR